MSPIIIVKCNNILYLTTLYVKYVLGTFFQHVIVNLEVYAVPVFRRRPVLSSNERETLRRPFFFSRLTRERWFVFLSDSNSKFVVDYVVDQNAPPVMPRNRRLLFFLYGD